MNAALQRHPQSGSMNRPEHALFICSIAPDNLAALNILLEQSRQPLSGLHRASGSGSLLHTFQKKIHPGLPIAVGTHRVQQFVIGGAVLFEI